MNNDLSQGYIKNFRKIIQDIASNEIKKKNITNYVSGIVESVNEDGTVNVFIPPDNTNVISNLLNKAMESLTPGDSVEICTKNGKLNNAWIAIKHGTNVSGGGGIPTGGTAGQVLAKNSNNNYDVHWVNAGAGSGDMLKSIYDPNNKNADAFNMDNMVESATRKILTSAERTKLENIASGAEVNVNADWNATSGDAQILNKPSIPTTLSQLTDDSTHRLVTDTEKSTWNAKQNAMVADTDYLTPGTASSTYQVKMGVDDNYVTDAEKVVIGNTSNTNTGDETAATIKSKLGITTLTGSNTGDQIVPANTSATSNQFFTAYNNTTGVFTKAQPTWANINKSTSSIADITTKSHTLLTDIGNNTHAQIDAALTRLAGTSGSNTGDQDLSSYALKTYVDGKGIFYVTSYNDFVEALQNTTYYQKVIYSYYNFDTWNNAVTATINVYGINYVYGDVKINEESVTNPTLTFSGSSSSAGDDFIYCYGNFGIMGILTLDGACHIYVNTFWTSGITINDTDTSFKYMRTPTGALAPSPNAHQENWFIDSPAFVHNTGAETIDGVKTFNSIPVLPSTDPTLNNQAATKGYVDAHSGGSTLVKATGADIQTGTDDTKYVTPKSLTDAGNILSTDNSVSDIQTLTQAEYDALTSAQRANKLFNITDEIDVSIGVENVLTSTSTTNALSANQGKILNDKILGFTPVSLLATPLQAGSTLSVDVNATLSDNYTNYDLLLIYVSQGINGAEGRWDFVMPSLPTCYWEDYVLGGYNAHGRVQFNNNNKVSFMVREITGWSSTSMYLSKVMGVKLTH